jgi:hypothetical protein
MPAWLKIAAIVLLPLLFVSPSLAASDFDPDETQRLYFEALDQCEQTGYDKTQPSCKIHLIYGQELDKNGWCQSGAGRRPAWFLCEPISTPDVPTLEIDGYFVSDLQSIVSSECKNEPNQYLEVCSLSDDLLKWLEANMCRHTGPESAEIPWVTCDTKNQN